MRQKCLTDEYWISHHSCSIILITSTFPGLAKQKLSSKLVFFGCLSWQFEVWWNGVGANFHAGLSLLVNHNCWVVQYWYYCYVFENDSRLRKDWLRINNRRLNFEGFFLPTECVTFSYFNSILFSILGSSSSRIFYIIQGAKQF